MAFAAKLPQKLPHAAPGGRASLYCARNRHTGLKAPGIVKVLPRLGAIAVRRVFGGLDQISVQDRAGDSPAPYA